MEAKRGRPRKAISDNEETQKKRDYQRTYQEARLAKIAELNRRIEECEKDLKKMKDERKKLRKMAKDKLDTMLVGIPYDPEQPNALKKALAYKKQIEKGNKIKP